MLQRFHQSSIKDQKVNKVSKSYFLLPKSYLISVYNMYLFVFLQVRRLINEDGDYAAYGYLPFSAKQTRIVNKMREDHYREGGTYN